MSRDKSMLLSGSRANASAHLCDGTIKRDWYAGDII